MQATLIKLSTAEKKSHENRSRIRWEEGDAVRAGGDVRRQRDVPRTLYACI